MKTKTIFLLCMFIAIITFGQNQGESMVKEVKVTPPKFIGSEKFVPMMQKQKSETINDYLTKNVQYPETAIKSRDEGSVVVLFIVTSAGELTEFQVMNSVSPEIDSEVIRTLEKTNGMWSPGTNNGEPVAMEKEVLVSFKMDYSDDSDITKTNDFESIAERYFNQGNKRFLIKEKPEKALKSYNNGIRYLPNETSLLLVRGLCSYELGNKEDAFRDWNRIKTLGGIDFGDEYLAENFNDLKGYTEMISMIE